MKRREFLKGAALTAAGFAAGLTQRAGAQSGCDLELSGDFSGTVPSGELWRIGGDVNLTGDLIVEGTLVGEGSFTIEGNGFQILVQHGGKLDLAGVEKTAWCRWGDPVVGWQTGDRLSVAPTAFKTFTPTEIAWDGWGIQPSPNMTLVDGRIARPEVVNLSQTVTLRNLARIMIHNEAGIQRLRWLRIVDSGTSELGFYPLHFHLLGESARGSVIEGVVVEGGKHHAFVPHGSHGITFRGTAAVETKGDAYWWDPPAGNTANNSNDILWENALALRVFPVDSADRRVSAFRLGAGTGNRIVGSVAVALMGGEAFQTSGFHWPENGAGVWGFADNLAHNCKAFGIFNWTNDFTRVHEIERFDSYHCLRAGIDNGAYGGLFQYADITSTQDGRGQYGEGSIVSHAKSIQPDSTRFEDCLTDGELVITQSNVTLSNFVLVARAAFTGVTVRAIATDVFYRFEDCGLTPQDFTLSSLGAGSVLEIWEGGVLTHRWAGGW